MTTAIFSESESESMYEVVVGTAVGRKKNYFYYYTSTGSAGQRNKIHRVPTLLYKRQKKGKFFHFCFFLVCFRP